MIKKTLYKEYFRRSVIIMTANIMKKTNHGKDLHKYKNLHCILNQCIVCSRYLANHFGKYDHTSV